MNKLKKWFSNITLTDWIAISILIIAIAGMFVLPYWLTHKSWKHHINIEKPNEIGDTLGGILGPFIGLISAFLVYLALREQIKANKFLAEEINRKDSEKYEFVIFNRIKQEFQNTITEIKNYQPYWAPIDGHYDEEDQEIKINGELFDYENNLIFENDVIYSHVMSSIILTKYDQIGKLRPNYAPILRYLDKLIFILESVHKEIKVQKYLKKEIEYLFLDTFQYFDFQSLRKFDTSKVKLLKSRLQLKHLMQLLMLSKLFENLKKEFDEDLKKDFDKIFYKRYKIDSTIEKAIIEQEEILNAE